MNLPAKPTKKNHSVAFVLICSSLVLMISFGVRSSFGLFVNPISDFNAWGRETISFSIAIQNLTWGVMAFFAGGIADKYGLLKVTITGAVLYALGLFLMVGVDDQATLILSSGLLVGSGVAGTSFGLILPALARAVSEHKRQLVLGIGTAAGSLGQFIMVQFAQVLLELWDWKVALLVLSLSTLSIIIFTLPLAPYSGVAESKKGSKKTDQLDLPLFQVFKNALSNNSYIFLFLGFFVCGFQLAFITAHLPPFLVDLGFASSVGAWSISLIGIFNVIGAYLAGYFSGKKSKKYILSGIYFARAVVIGLFLLFPISITSVILFSMSMGLLWLATVPPTSGLVAVMFGTRYMSLLYGFVFLSHQIGSFFGVWLGGFLYDIYGDYSSIWWLGVVLALLAGLIHLPIKENSYRLSYT